jgi:hypothetical protein
MAAVLNRTHLATTIACRGGEFVQAHKRWHGWTVVSGVPGDPRWIEHGDHPNRSSADAQAWEVAELLELSRQVAAAKLPEPAPA